MEGLVRTIKNAVEEKYKRSKEAVKRLHAEALQLTEEKEQQLEETRERVQCVICQKRERAVIFAPCRHMVCCRPCADQLRAVCPLDRGPIASMTDVIWA